MDNVHSMPYFGGWKGSTWYPNIGIYWYSSTNMLCMLVPNKLIILLGLVAFAAKLSNFEPWFI